MELRLVAWAISVGLICSASAAFGQAYPNKTVRIVTSGVGGGTDAVARQIAQGLSGLLGQPVIVDNRPTGVIPGEVVSKAPPDGYTLLSTPGTLWIGPLLYKTSYDAVKDFAPISLMVIAPQVLVVHPSLPVKSVKELIALAKSRPGELNYSSSATGSSSHLAGELFKAMAHVNITRIPYKSGAMEMADMLGGHVQLSFGSVSTVRPHVKSGRLRAVAITSAKPSDLAPGLPTIAASGVPDYESASAQALFAPAKTPEAIIKRLHQEVVHYLKTAEAKEQLLSTGQEAIGSSPEQLAAWVRSETARLGKMISDAGIRGE